MILLCTASNSYIEKYRPCIDSQKIFCSRNNYFYKLVTGKQEDRNWKRAKIDELELLLTSQNDNVCLIDSDCLIKDTCPPFETFLTKNIINF